MQGKRTEQSITQQQPHHRDLNSAFATPLILLVTVFLLAPSASHSVQLPRISASASPPAPVVDAEEHQANLAFALTELNALAADDASLLGYTRPGSSDASPPVYALHHRYSARAVDSAGELLQVRPFYRTVQGWDDRRNRPVLYRTLVHETVPVRARVGRSVTYHLALRRRSEEEMAKQADDAAHARLHECAASSAAVCTPPPTPSPLSLLHAVLTVSTDAEGSRAITMRRLANERELGRWWAAHLARESDAERLSGEEASVPASTRLAHMQQQHLDLLERCTLPLATVLALGGLQEATAAAAAAAEADTDNNGSDSVASSASSSSGLLKAMSVNIWNYNYWVRRQPLLHSVLSSESPDVVGVQEVRAVKAGPGTGQGRWQSTDLSHMLPAFDYVFEPAMGFREGADWVHEGLAIYSRFRIARVDVLRLSRNPNDSQDFHQRLALRVLLRTPHGRLNFLTTHLSLSHAARQRTLPEIARFVAQLGERDGAHPTLLTGDFNAQFDQGPQLLTREENGAFVDAWMESQRLKRERKRKAAANSKEGECESDDHSDCNGDEDDSSANDPASRSSPSSSTASPNASTESESDDCLGWTFNAWDPRSRIDFILLKSDSTMRPRVVVDSTRVVGSEGVSLQGEALPPIGGVSDMKDTMFPSDHMFLAASFRIHSHDDHEAERSTRQAQQAGAAHEQHATVGHTASSRSGRSLSGPPHTSAHTKDEL